MSHKTMAILVKLLYSLCPIISVRGNDELIKKNITESYSSMLGYPKNKTTMKRLAVDYKSCEHCTKI